MLRNSRFQPLLLILVALVFVSAPTPELARATTLEMAPFKVQAKEDKEFLRAAVQSMLASRLTASAKLEMVTRGGDYLLSGTITVIGQGVSIAADLQRAGSSEKPAAYVVSAASEDGVVAAVDELAVKISAGSFGVGQAPGPKAAPAPSPAQPFATGHPDRPFLKASPAAPASPAPASAPLPVPAPGGAPAVSAGPAPGGLVKSADLGFTRTQKVKLALADMAVGDMDGDGQPEVVLAEKFKAVCYHLQGQRLVKFAEISLAKQYKIVALDLADLDGDGQAELYVSGVKGGRPSSLAARWQAGTWHYLFKDADWFVRPLLVPGRGLVLAGQGSGQLKPFAGLIFEMFSGGSSLQAGQPLPLPPGLNLYNFALADLDGNGQAEIVAIGESDYLRVMDGAGTVLWKSSDHFGGSVSFVGGQDVLSRRAGRPGHQEVDPMDGEELRRVYLPTPIIVTDLNGDGRHEIVVNKNPESVSRVLENVKNYPSGEIMALGWDGLGLSELWRTKKIEGYVASYALHGPKLYVGLDLSRSLNDFFAAKKATVLLFPLGK